MLDKQADLARFVADYHENGFAVIENFLSEEELNEIRAETDKLIKESDEDKNLHLFDTVITSYNAKSKHYLDSAGKISYFSELGAYDLKTGERKVPLENSLAKIAHAIHTNPVFKKHTISDKVRKVFKAVEFENPVVMQSMVIFKNPQVGGEYLPHQDAQYLCCDPPKHVAGIWIAMDDASPENGCLEFIPGSHKKDLVRRYVRIPEEKQKDKGGALLEWTRENEKYEDSHFVPVPVKKGSAVLLHGLAVHRSAANTSNKSRWIYTFHVYDQAKSKYLEDNWCQPENYSSFIPIYAK